ncbi:hypothetical protein CL634_05820 [bacterium]|nr:hypothetical protein [bacterium]
MENSFILGGRLDIGITQISAAKLVAGQPCFGTSDQKITFQEWIKKDETYLIFGAASGAAELLRIQKEFNLKYVIFQTENLKSLCFSDSVMMGASYKALLKQNLVLDWSSYNAKLMKEKYDIDVAGTFMFEFPRRETDLTDEEKKEYRAAVANDNTGYDFLLGVIDDDANRDIDLFFCGARNDARQAELDKIFENRNGKRCYWELSYTLCAPQSLNELLLRSKFVLNIPYYDDAPLATHRINKALALGCQVISPHSPDEELDKMYADYVHFGDVHELVKNLDELPEKRGYVDFHRRIGSNVIGNSLKIIKEHG